MVICHVGHTHTLAHTLRRNVSPCPFPASNHRQIIFKRTSFHLHCNIPTSGEGQEVNCWVKLSMRGQLVKIPISVTFDMIGTERLFVDGDLGWRSQAGSNAFCAFICNLQTHHSMKCVHFNHFKMYILVFFTT